MKETELYSRADRETVVMGEFKLLVDDRRNWQLASAGAAVVFLQPIRKSVTDVFHWACPRVALTGPKWRGPSRRRRVRSVI